MSKYEIIADFIADRNGEVAEVDVIRHERPRVFIFHGALAVNRKEAQDALGETKKFFNDMGLKDYDFYSSYYTRKTLIGFLKFQRGTESEREVLKKEFEEATKPIFDDILLPLIQEKGKRLNKEKVRENFSKIVFRGHCMGSLFVTNLGNILYREMTRLGYFEDEVKELTFGIKAIFSSSIVLPHEIEANFDIYSYINLGDDELFKYAGEDWRMNLLYMTGAKVRPDKPTVSILKANNIDFVILSSLFDNKTVAELDVDIKKAIEAGDKNRLRKLEKVRLGHAWTLLSRPYKEFDGVNEAYDKYKDMVGKVLK